MIEFDLENTDLLNDLVLSEIDSVYLSLNVLFSDVYIPKVCSLHTVDYEWEEMEVTWLQASNNQPWYMVPQTGNDDTFALEDAGDMDIVPIDTTMHALMEEWQDWNVTEIIKSYLQNSNENHGFMIRSGAELQPHFYYSSEHDSLHLRPKLTFFTNGVDVKSKLLNSKSNFEIQKSGSVLYLNFNKRQSAKIELFSVKGRLLYSKSMNNSNKCSINLNKQATGYMYGRVTSENEVYPFTVINNF